MERILSQDEIDALFRAARGRSSGAESPGQDAPGIKRWDFRQTSEITKEQARSLSLLHDNFARNLSHSLGAYLRVVFEVNVVSVEEITWSEFIQRVPETNYLASLSVQPLDATAAVQMDLPLAYPMVDLLLGGEGKTAPELRDITEIEEQILESVVRIICRELRGAFHPLFQFDFVFEQRQQLAQILRMLPLDERILTLSFEIHMPNVMGMLTLVFPSVLSTALLRKLTQQWSHRKRRGSADSAAHLRERLLECPFEIGLNLGPAPLSARALLGLKPGDVLPLPYKATEPAFLWVNQRKMFTASPVRSGKQRAGQLRARHSIAASLLEEKQ